LIVDDHPVVREGLSALISGQPDLAVCGQAAGCAEAVTLTATTRPDLVIVDISLKDGNGIELIKRIRARDASVRFLVSSMHDESVYAERALRAGALGFLGKQESTQKILDAIRRVLEGKIYVSERMSERLLHGLVAGSRERSSVETLADRELQVFELIGQGLNTRQIAAQLHLSTKTVETYRGRIRTKLNIGGGGELAHYAMQWVMQTGQEQAGGRGESGEFKQVGGPKRAAEAPR
jgi:DNA-binding NarL/FixJ family response regulator